MPLPARPDYRRKRLPPRKTAGAPALLRNDDITWTRQVQPREQYRVVYVDRDNLRSERVIELLRTGELEGTQYLGVMHQGKFKTLRSDRVVDVLEQISTGHAPSLRRPLRYGDELPKFPLDDALYKVGTVAASNRTWTVDLNGYTCTCPEKRIRAGFGYAPGQLGFVCPHMARALCDHLPAGNDWSPELLAFLRDPRRVHIDNLV